jgi:acetolactate synthase-1/2/3 large subunit
MNRLMSLAHDARPQAAVRAEMPIGDFVARYLADIGVTTVFGVISIHNMPILDAIFRQQRIRFVPARGEAGAMNMADASARLTRSLGVVVTSTGTAAGNAAGSQVEALTAGSPVLHITSQIDRPFMDRDRAAIHDVPRQPDMLKAVSKAYFRIWDARTAPATLAAAVEAALTSPRGPVSLEIPIDVQREVIEAPIEIVKPTPPTRVPAPDLLDEVARLALHAKRPMLWLGGGARDAAEAATALVDRGFAAVTSTSGRAVVPESHPRSLGAFNMLPEAEAIYRGSDLMVVVGSKLRGNETRNNQMPLPRPLVQIDADPTQGGRNYPVDLFVCGDARLALEGLASRLPKLPSLDKSFGHDVAIARARAEGALRVKLGPYQTVADVLLQRVSTGRHPFVRDVTVANSTFGNRYVQIAAPHLGIHAAGGGIGQGIAMAIGAALSAPSPKTVALLGDGGAMVNLAELLTAVQEKAEIVFVLMNDLGYGVIRNIQDAQYGGRRSYSDVRTPDFAMMAASFGLPHTKVTAIDAFEQVFDQALATPGPFVIEIDMAAIGPYAEPFGGPPAGAAGKAG